jgi:hypothetical protein
MIMRIILEISVPYVVSVDTVRSTDKCLAIDRRWPIGGAYGSPECSGWYSQNGQPYGTRARDRSVVWHHWRLAAAPTMNRRWWQCNGRLWCAEIKSTLSTRRWREDGRYFDQARRATGSRLSTPPEPWTEHSPTLPPHWRQSAQTCQT